jgi:hypothetical protein
MLLKAILTTLILGTSSVAMAQTYQPYQTDYNRTYDTAPAQRGRFMRRQYVLASNVVLAADTQAAFIRIDPRLRLSRVRIDLESGRRAYIESVFVMHADGRQESVPVRQIISRNTPRLVIDLAGRRDVTGIAINSSQMRSARGAGSRYMGAVTVNVVGVRRR